MAINTREKQVLEFFNQHKDAIIEDVALHYTGESRQNLFNSAFFRFKQLGILKETDLTRDTTNNHPAKVYTKGRNFDRLELLGSRVTKTVKLFLKEANSQKSSTKKNMRFKSASSVKKAVINGELTKASLYSSISYHKKANPAYAEILISGKKML